MRGSLGIGDGDWSGGGKLLAELAVAFQGGGDGWVVGGAQHDRDLARCEPSGGGEIS